MADAKKCDRCGKLYEDCGIKFQEEPVDGLCLRYGDLGIKGWFDLCHGCMNELVTWLMVKGAFVTKLYTVELLPEQVKKQWLKIHPFERVEDDANYYLIDCDGNIWLEWENNDESSDRQYNIANYCTDKDIMKQRALHETLNRLLWRFSMQNGGDDIEWGSGKTAKWRICPISTHDWTVDYNYSQGVGTVYFASEELAEQAIEEIVKPFIEEHPEFEVGGCCL